MLQRHSQLALTTNEEISILIHLTTLTLALQSIRQQLADRQSTVDKEHLVNALAKTSILLDTLLNGQ